jgi:hypothetical protein
MGQPQIINLKQSIFFNFTISLSFNKYYEHFANVFSFCVSLNNTAFGSRAEVPLTSDKGKFVCKDVYTWTKYSHSLLLSLVFYTRYKIYTFFAPFVGFPLKGTESQDRF